MLRSILIGLDGSRYSEAVTELGMHWANLYEASITGIAVIDRPAIVENSAKAIFSANRVYENELAEATQKAEAVLEKSRKQCQGSGVSMKTIQECGPPAAEILLEAQRHDVILLGKQTYFRFDTGSEEDDVVHKVIEHAPRPVVVTPEGSEHPATTVIAYDSSLQAAKALASFVSSGLAEKHKLHLVCVEERAEKAEQKILRAVDFLNNHRCEFSAHAIESEADVGDVLLDQVGKLEAGLLVMGVFGKPSLQSFFFGSTTKKILNDSTVPVFVYH